MRVSDIGFCCCCLVGKTCLTLLQLQGQQPARLLCPRGFLGNHMEWVAISFLRGSSQPRDRTHISWIGRHVLYWATREVHILCYLNVLLKLILITLIYLILIKNFNNCNNFYLFWMLLLENLRLYLQLMSYFNWTALVCTFWRPLIVT